MVTSKPYLNTTKAVLFLQNLSNHNSYATIPTETDIILNQFLQVHYLRVLPLEISNLPSVSDNYVFRPLLRVPKILFYVWMHLYIFSQKKNKKKKKANE